MTLSRNFMLIELCLRKASETYDKNLWAQRSRDWWILKRTVPRLFNIWSYKIGCALFFSCLRVKTLVSRKNLRQHFVKEMNSRPFKILYCKRVFERCKYLEYPKEYLPVSLNLPLSQKIFKCWVSIKSPNQGKGEFWRSLHSSLESLNRGILWPLISTSKLAKLFLILTSKPLISPVFECIATANSFAITGSVVIIK